MARRALALVLLVAACAAPPPDTAPASTVPGTTGDTCEAAPRQGLVGQDATALERVLILGPVRVIRPGEPVTRDLSPGRINFDIDAGERIVRVWCG